MPYLVSLPQHRLASPLILLALTLPFGSHVEISLWFLVLCEFPTVLPEANLVGVWIWFFLLSSYWNLVVIVVVSGDGAFNWGLDHGDSGFLLLQNCIFSTREQVVNKLIYPIFSPSHVTSCPCAFCCELRQCEALTRPEQTLHHAFAHPSLQSHKPVFSINKSASGILLQQQKMD
jgi:hypothetical protein